MRASFQHRREHDRRRAEVSLQPDRQAVRQTAILSPLGNRAALISTVLALSLVLLPGCSTYDLHRLFHNNEYDSYEATVTQPLPTRVEYAPPIELVPDADSRIPIGPHMLDEGGEIREENYRSINLDEAIQYGLQNSKVMRDLGGTVLRAPESTRTRYETALQETNPQFGPEAALSAFDAQFASKAYFQKNDRALNNVFFGGGTRLLRQDLNVYQTEISKTAATGSTFALRNNTDYDNNNAPGNRFPHAWNTNIEAEVRQPLLQGGGVLFNRIAGPNSIPGVPRGVLIAQVDNDIAQEDFDRELQNFVSEIVNAYWELYYAYRDLEGKKNARDAALETLNSLEAIRKTGDIDETKIDLAREQYYRFEEEVENAVAGVPQQITRTSTGSANGSFRALGGVLASERRLRYLIGYTINDEQILRPSADSEPPKAEYSYDWLAVANEALMRRPELRQQRLVVKRRDMELVAARNFVSPQLDAIGLYRWRGFGRNLLDSDGSGKTRFDNAVDDLVSGDFQEWQLGVEFSVPIGFRQALAAVHHAELQVAKATAVLREQERFVLLELSNAVAESKRAYRVSQTALNRVLATKELSDTLSAQEETQLQTAEATLDQTLDAQRRLADAHTRFYRVRAEYAVAIKNVEYEKGSILDNYDVYVMQDGIVPSMPSVPLEVPAPPVETPVPVPPGPEVEGVSTPQKPIEAETAAGAAAVPRATTLTDEGTARVTGIASAEADGPKVATVPPETVAPENVEALDTPSPIQVDSTATSAIPPADSMPAPGRVLPAPDFPDSTASSETNNAAFETEQLKSEQPKIEQPTSLPEWSVETPNTVAPANGPTVSPENGSNAVFNPAAEAPVDNHPVQPTGIPDWSEDTAEPAPLQSESHAEQNAATTNSFDTTPIQPTKTPDLSSATDAEFWQDGAAATAQDDLELREQAEPAHGIDQTGEAGQPQVFPAGGETWEQHPTEMPPSQPPALLHSEAPPAMTPQISRGPAAYSPGRARQTRLQRIWSNRGGRQTHRIPTHNDNVPPAGMNQEDAGRVQLSPDEPARINLNDVR
jgi:outer membrane protein TolC